MGAPRLPLAAPPGTLIGAALPLDYTPRGFVYTLEFRAVSDCLIEDIGPDMV